ncbi:MAG: hypothetical protein Q8P34_07345 [Bacteroidota bacterium]|nr:hypothetical protein [Bacteroidota bacterium]
MKTIIAISFLIVTTLMSQLSLASGTFLVNLVPQTEEMALLKISNNDGQKYEISILNSMGDLVYFHETKEASRNFNRMFDFSQLEHGDYKVEVKIDGASNEQLMTINKKGIVVGNSSKRTAPFFNYKDNVLSLSYLNHSIEEMSMNIYQKSNLIWETKMDAQFVLHKGFDLSKLKRGEYTVVFSAGNEIYEYDLTRN